GELTKSQSLAGRLRPTARYCVGSAFREGERGMRIPLGGLLLIVLSFSAAQTAHTQPPTAESWVAEGNRYAHERQYDKAVDAFKQALRINPDLAGAHLGLGSAYHNMGRLADALRPLTATVRLQPRKAS